MTPDDARARLRQILEQRALVQQLTARLESLVEQRKEIEADQTRIRSNMNALDRTSTLYGNYVKTLEDQESQIRSLREQERTTRQQVQQTSRDALFSENDDPFGTP